MQHLADANALIAPCWSAHVHHDTVLAWFNRHAKAGWATCALSQAGCVRVLSRPAMGEAASTVAELAQALAHYLDHPAHRLLPLDFDFAEVLARCAGGVVGHRQLTDAYLLTTATRAGMKLHTVDSGVRALLAGEAERMAHIELLR